MLDFEPQQQDVVNPIDQFKDKLDQINDLGAIQHIYTQLTTRTSKAPPEVIEYAKQRLAQLTQEDKVDLTAPINRGVQSLAGSMGQTMTSQLPEMSFSKAGAGKMVDKGVDVLGGAGLALLSASEGWRGKPLTEAMHLNEMGFNREKLAESKRKTDIESLLAQQKQFKQDTKDALEFSKGELATIRLHRQAAEGGDPTAISALQESYKRTEQLYPKIGGQLWKRMYEQPDASEGFLDSLAEGQYDVAFSRATSLDEMGKPLLEIMGNDQQMALNELRYVRKYGKRDEETGQTLVANKKRGYSRAYNPQEIEDLRTRGKLKSGAEVSKEQSEATLSGQKAKEATEQAGLRLEKLEGEVSKAKRELAQQDLEEYQKIVQSSIKLAGGGGMSFETTASGGISFTAGDMSKLDMDKLAKALRQQAKTAPGISAATKAALYDLAEEVLGKGATRKFDKQGHELK